MSPSLPCAQWGPHGLDAADKKLQEDAAFGPGCIRNALRQAPMRLGEDGCLFKDSAIEDAMSKLLSPKDDKGREYNRWGFRGNAKHVDWHKKTREAFAKRYELTRNPMHAIPSTLNFVVPSPPEKMVNLRDWSPDPNSRPTYPQHPDSPDDTT